MDITDAPTDDGLDATTAANGWSLAPIPAATTATLWGAFSFSATDWWIAGASATLQQFTGATWTAPSNPATDVLYALWGQSPADIWTVGRNCAALRWSGSNWAAVTVTPCGGNTNLLSVDGSGVSNVWVAGTSGTIVQWTGAAWQNHSLTNLDFWSVLVESTTSVYLVGTRGSLLHYDGLAFSSEAGLPDVTLADIWASPNGDHWVVGEGGTILHKPGAGAWVVEPSPTTSFLYAVDGTAADDVWAVGTGGVMLHFDGATWSTSVSPTAATLRNLAAVPGGGGMIAVGDTGTVLVRP